MAEATTAKFLQGGLMRHIAVMSVTSSFGLMAIFLVDFVDMIFISMLGKAELAAAVGYSGAILFFTTSAGIGLAITGGAMVARALGQGDLERAREHMTNVLVLGCSFAVLLAYVVWINLENLLVLIGAKGQAVVLGLEYLQIIVPSMPLLVTGMIASAVLRAHGEARAAMMVTLLAGLVNAVLDPIFIFGFGLELKGAALASVASRITIVIAAVIPIMNRLGGFKSLAISTFLRDLSPILAIAVPSMLANIATPVGSAYVTWAMAQFGEDAVAGLAIVSRITPVAFALVFALSGAVGPIIGQNIGAGNVDRVRRTFIDSTIFVGVYILAVAVGLFFLRGPIADLFSVQGVARDLVYLFCGPLALLWFFNGVIFIGNAGFNNLSHPFYATGINWSRSTLGVVPFVMICAYFWGPQGVLIGQAFGGVIFAGISCLLVKKVLAEQRQEPTPTDPSDFSRFTRVMRMFHARR